MLPFLAAALTRHLEQFPSVRNGLSRSEHQILEIVDAGTATLKHVFREAAGKEEAEFLGDAVFAHYVEVLSDVLQPLVLFEDGSTIHAPTGPDPEPSFWNSSLILTDAGRAVLRGKDDYVRLNGIDKWLGGVQLTAECFWRWDETSGTLKKNDTAQ